MKRYVLLHLPAGDTPAIDDDGTIYSYGIMATLRSTIEADGHKITELTESPVAVPVEALQQILRYAEQERTETFGCDYEQHHPQFAIVRQWLDEIGGTDGE